MNIAIINNAKIKNREQLDKKTLEQLAEKYNFKYELFIPKPHEMEKLLSSLLHKQFDVFLVVGGDGTVRTAAQVLVNQEIPLAILPSGTFNHFAKELKLPEDIESLIKIIKLNKVKKVDVAEVNDVIFINNSSIGFYSHVLKLRKKYEDVVSQNKLFKIIFTSLNIFKVIPIYRLKIKINNKAVVYNTCLIFIGNNYYFTAPPDLGERENLTSGFLSVYILKCKNRWDLIKCFISMLFNTLDKNKYLSEYQTDRLTISSQSKQINVIVDGELFKLNSPLNYTIHHKKLPVIIP